MAADQVRSAITVDEYMYENRIDRIDLLKIDTEGNEEAVLRGSMRHLEDRKIEFVLCECDFTARPDEPHGDFRTVLGLLEPLAYRVVSVYTNGVDNLGWLWGDVLFRYAPGQPDRHSWVTSPYVQRHSARFRTRQVQTRRTTLPDRAASRGVVHPHRQA